MFDKANEVSGENPRHMDFIQNKAKPLFERWGYNVEILRADKDYLDLFYHIIEHPKKYKEHAGMYTGFPASGACSVKRDCKLKPINDYYMSLTEPFTQYVGICIDEPKRLKALHNRDQFKGATVSLLEKYGYTEAMARKKCLEYGLLSPSYDLSRRSGCWFCPNAKLEEHKELRRTNPDLWDRFVALENEENLAKEKWNVFGESLQKREERLAWECSQPSVSQINLFELI